MPKIIDVAAAVILRKDGSFLLGRRPAHTTYAGYWEFPGGKVEAGESPYEALVRELQEELDISVELAWPWITREFVYPHAHVRLHFFRVARWLGEPRELHHEALAWQHSGHINVAPLLPANAPVLSALALPHFYAISHACEIGATRQLAALEHSLERGLRLVQLREAALPAPKRAEFIHAAVHLCHGAGARVLVNGDDSLAHATLADGVHLSSSRIMALNQRPAFPLVAASCHNAAELAQAARLGLDFVVLGPVRETLSHPGLSGMGWDAFSQLLGEPPYSLPVYALGGLAIGDMKTAWQAGAHGIAAIRAAWGEG